MVDYKVGDLSRLLQTACTELPKADVSFLTSKKPAVAKISKETDNKQIKQTHKNEEKVEKKRKKKKKKTKNETSDRNTDVIQTKKEVTSANIESAEPKKKKKKKKQKSDKTNRGIDRQSGYNPPAGIVHEAIAARAEKDKSETKSPKKRKIEDDDSEEDVVKSKKSKLREGNTRPRRDRVNKKTDNRTIFIGNLPISVGKKSLLKMFKGFGEIESVRYRCLPVNDPSVPKKVIAITKDFHPQRHNCAAYICFKEEESAQKALSKNGIELEGLHIRVDLAGKKDKSDMKKSVFVGNLPYNLEEEQLREHFEDCGTVENVRIVRDKNTCIGKGFGYVKFSDTDAVSFATKLNGSTINKREIRVMPCVSKLKVKGARDKVKPFNKTKKNFVKQKAGGSMKPRQPEKQNKGNRDGKSGESSHIIFDEGSDVKQKHSVKYKDRNDKKSRKNFKGKDGKPKRKSFRPSNMKKNPFHSKLARKESKKQKHKQKQNPKS